MKFQIFLGTTKMFYAKLKEKLRSFFVRAVKSAFADSNADLRNIVTRIAEQSIKSSYTDSNAELENIVLELPNNPLEKSRLIIFPPLLLKILMYLLKRLDQLKII
jgi:hypothetical protein